MNVSTIRDQLKTLAETVSGVRGYDTVPGSPTPPAGGVAAIVAPTDPFLSYPTEDDSVVDLSFTVTAITGRADETAAQDNLDSFLAAGGATSLRAALESGHVANVWDYSAVTGVRQYGVFTFGQGADAIAYLGCQLSVVVGCS